MHDIPYQQEARGWDMLGHQSGCFQEGVLTLLGLYSGNHTNKRNILPDTELRANASPIAMPVVR